MKLVFLKLCDVLAFPFPSRSVAVCSYALAFLELSVLWHVPAGFWSNGGLSELDRTILALFALLSWAIHAWMIFWLVQAVRAFSHRFDSRIARRSSMTAFVIAIGSCVFSYLAAWVFFVRIGVFPTMDAINFALVNSWLLVLHLWQAEPRFVVGCVTLYVVCCLLTTVFLRQVLAYPVARPLQGAIWKTALAAWVSINCVMWVSIRDGDVVNMQNRTTIARRLLAIDRQWPPFAFEMSHVNPTVCAASTWIKSTSNVAQLQHNNGVDLPPETLVPRQPMPVKEPSRDRESSYSVVIFVVESLRSDVVGLRHEDQLVMPTLTRLAATGCCFSQCYTQSVHSDYSDPCILSSLYPLRKDQYYFYRHRELLRLGLTVPDCLIFSVRRLGCPESLDGRIKIGRQLPPVGLVVG